MGTRTVIFDSLVREPIFQPSETEVREVAKNAVMCLHKITALKVMIKIMLSSVMLFVYEVLSMSTH